MWPHMKSALYIMFIHTVHRMFRKVLVNLKDVKYSVTNVKIPLFPELLFWTNQ